MNEINGNSESNNNEDFQQPQDSYVQPPYQQPQPFDQQAQSTDPLPLDQQPQSTDPQDYQPLNNQADAAFTDDAFTGDAAIQQKSAKGSAPKTIIGVLVAVIAIGAICVSSWAAILKVVSPKDYLSLAITNTVNNITAKSTGLPDFSKFNDKPAEADIALGVDSIDGISGDEAQMLKGSDIALSTKYDKKGRKMLITGSANIAGVGSFEDNSIFVSNEALGVKMPFLFTDYDYITVDPKTFVSDWNNSDVFSQNFEMPEDFDINSYIDLLFKDFGDLKNDEDFPDVDKFKTEIADLAKELISASEFVNGGNETIKIDGESKNYTKLSYDINKEAAKEYFSGVLTVYKPFMLDIIDYFDSLSGGQYSAMLFGNSGTDAEEVIDQLIDSLDMIEFSDFSMDFYIGGNDMVSRFEISGLKISVKSELSSEPVNVGLNFYMDMYGKNNVLDELDAKLTATVMNQKASVGIKRTNDSKKNAFNDKIVLDVITQGATVMKATYTMTWDPGKESGNNMTVNIGLQPIMQQETSLKLSGNLKDSGKEIRLSDGLLEINSAGSKVAGFSIDAGLKEIASSDVVMDGKDNTSLFDLDMTDFADAFNQLNGLEIQ